MESLNTVLASGQYHDLFAIIKGFRNGAVYGTLYYPLHAGPYCIQEYSLGNDSSVEDKMRFILKATYQHSRNLATFVTIYKTLMVLQRYAKGKESSSDAFVSGLIGGYFVFGKDDNINQQIVLYLFSRISMGLAKLAVKKQVLPQPPHAFPIFAALVWGHPMSMDSKVPILGIHCAGVGIVMWLFRHERDTLQPSLQASMQYLYNDSEVFDRFHNWLWHNVVQGGPGEAVKLVKP